MSSSGFWQKTKPLIGGPASRSANQRPGFLAGENSLNSSHDSNFGKKLPLDTLAVVVKTQILGTKPQKQVKRKEEEKSNLNLVCIGNISYRDQIDNI